LSATSPTRPVYIVDDDRHMRASLSLLLKSAGMAATAYMAGSDLLDDIDSLPPGCLLLDIRMPGLDGLSLLGELARRGITWPAVIMTGHGDLPTAISSIRLGAVDFLEKPFSDGDLFGALHRSFLLLDKSAPQRTAVEAHRRVERLSPREREVLSGLVAGKPTKQIANDLKLSPRTVEMHRSRLMRRLGTSNLTELLTLAAAAGLLNKAIGPSP
jgi:two-component system response regulator FixJ